MKTNVKYSLENSRWNDYNTYRFILWAWMTNEIAISSVAVGISHEGFCTCSITCTIVTIFFGIPLIYSEICIAQYTNCDTISIWNFCPILRGVGFGTFFWIPLKIIYLIVLASWNSEYTFVAVMDPPPWFSCDGYNEPKCMVKRVNVSTFQHCIESQKLFNQDCGMKTASSCFFEKIIGNNNTKLTNCINLWKIVLASFCFCTLSIVVLVKRKKLVKIIVKIFAVYICVVLFVLFCVALSSSGTWYSTTFVLNYEDFVFNNCLNVTTQSLLACGVGSGVISFLSRDVPFRSPATMTAVTTPLCSIFITIMFALIVFSGIKTVSYYHGGEQNILEVGQSSFFNAFASIAEIMSYFYGMPIWGFIWFSTVLACLFVSLMILNLFLFELLSMNFKFARDHEKICCVMVLSLLCVLSCPFYCSDLTVVLADVTEIIQLTSSFFFSAAIYWIYGFQKHNVDIIFMIGVKASYFWKIAWIANPVFTLFLVYTRWSQLLVTKYDNSYFISSMSINLNQFLFYFLISFYFFIVIIGMLIQFKLFYKYGKLRKIFSPLPNWGPRDEILFRSRKMFVPEIMTREFLYRQVRIHGYSRKRSTVNKRVIADVKLDRELSPEKIEWSALTSN